MTAFSGADGRLTPHMIQSYAFPSARFGRRGLEEAHVWEFCRLAEREVVRLLNERTSLADEVQRLRQRVLAGPGSGSGVGPDDAHVQAVAILSRAQQAADRYVADAQEYCRQLTDDARRLGDEILAEAKSRAVLVLEEAPGEPGLAAGARPDAGADVVTAPEGSERGELEAHLAYLRTFSDVYRAHLHAYLDNLLRNVEEWDRAEKETLTTVHADMSAPPDVPPLPPLPRITQ